MIRAGKAGSCGLGWLTEQGFSPQGSWSRLWLKRMDAESQLFLLSLNLHFRG